MEEVTKHFNIDVEYTLEKTVDKSKDMTEYNITYALLLPWFVNFHILFLVYFKMSLLIGHDLHKNAFTVLASNYYKRYYFILI